jgi:hypothetical protein
MTEEVDPEEFYDRTIKGTDQFKIIDLERQDGALLTDVELHVVSKEDLAEAISSMPEELFEAVDADEEDIDPEEAEEMAREAGGSTQVSPEMVEAFENLSVNSLHHDSYGTSQVRDIVDDFGFEMLFELGSEILTYSLENGGSVQTFHERS